MRTNAVFSGFSASLVSATIFMNPITLVMNYLYFLFWHHRRHCWNRTPSLSLFLSNGSNHGWTLGGPRYIHLTKGTNAVFSGFSATLASAAISMNPITKWWISIVTYFDIQVNPYWNRTLTYHFSTSVGVNHGWTLGGGCYIHLTKETNTHSSVPFYYIRCFMNCKYFIYNGFVSC